MSNLIGHNIAYEDAELDGYVIKSHPILNPYKVIEPNNTSKVNGVVYYDLDDDDIKKIDRYETSHYIRTNVELTNGESAHTYIEN